MRAAVAALAIAVGCGTPTTPPTAPAPITNDAESGVEVTPTPRDPLVPPAGAIETEVGALVVAGPASGPPPERNDRVRVAVVGLRTARGFESRQDVTFAVDLATTPAWWTILEHGREGARIQLYQAPGQVLDHHVLPGPVDQPRVYEMVIGDIMRAPEAPAHLDAAPANAAVGAHGIAERVLQPPSRSERPKLHDGVDVEVTVWEPGGRIASTTHFDRPRHVALYREKGLADLIMPMAIGEKRRLWLSTGDVDPRPFGWPDGPLVLDLTLVDIQRNPAAPPPPEHLKAPPASARKTASGLAYRFLRRGGAQARPTPDSMIEFHYTGWTSDGRMFDSSITRGKPMRARLRHLIAGWVEGVQLMSPGDEAILWIPESLAYGGRTGAPAGLLTFRVELLAIE